jgi:DNA-binding PadR family transcriptional regulator
MNKLLINESPIQVLPQLAKVIGLNEAIVLQQVHYWIENKKNKGYKRNGYKWVYNTYEKWQEDNFPFWSTRTIQRIFLKLEDLGLIISEQFSKQDYDQKKYYRINYDKLNEIEAGMSDCRDDSDKMASSEKTDGHNLNESETTSETTSEIKEGESDDSLMQQLKQAEKEIEEKSTSHEYKKRMKRNNPNPFVPKNERIKGLSNNLYDYPPDVQDTIKAFARLWDILPPPKGTDKFGKWIKYAREIKSLCNDIPPDVVLKEVYRDWKGEHGEGKFDVYDIASINNVVWPAVTRLITGRGRKNVKVYTDADGNKIEMEQ